MDATVVRPRGRAARKPPEKRGWLTVSEYCAVLGLAQSTVRWWCRHHGVVYDTRNQRVPVSRRGGDWMIPLSAIGGAR
jgi:phage antirepressor YoqD-like protein